MRQNDTTSISIVTATLNAMEFLPNLVSSLRAQTDKNFIWVVSDGGSQDGTIEFLSQIDDINIHLTVGDDFGIYDALNKAVKKCSTKYYCVAGADDIFYPSAIGLFKDCLRANSSVDIVALGWESGGKKYYPGTNSGWLMGMRGVASCHSVATLIKVSLHQKFGFYSSRYPVCADQLFIKKCIYSGCRVIRSHAIAGIYYHGGFSAKNALAAHFDFYRVQLETEPKKTLQFFIFLCRIIKANLVFLFSEKRI